jgi:methylenetetrahydrofolate dehydrogenase (NADP+)/methenyltetrahydrofolate cyclohydrolase
MAEILLGTVVRDKIKIELKEKVSKLSFKPILCIIQVGDREDSTIYINQKKKFGEEIGVDVSIKKFSSDISELDLKAEIETLNKDSSVGGIIVQLPLPVHISKNVIENIDQNKDVDGLTLRNQENLYQGKNGAILPATARAVINILDFYKISISGKKIAVLGRSELVGKPTAFVLQIRGGLVSVIHSQTENPKEITKNADIIVVAIGKPNMIDGSFLGDNKPVIIDVGIHRVQIADSIETKIVGDVDFSSVENLVSFITPVPKGVGPVTVCSLFQNLLDVLK